MKKRLGILLSTHVRVLMICFVLLAVWRVILLQPSMGMIALYSPVGAIALCLGMYLRQRALPYVLFLVFMLVSDALIMEVFYPSHQGDFLYKGWVSNYICLMLMVVIGKFLNSKPNLARIALGGIASSVVYFVASNTLVWYFGNNILTGLPFEKSLQGLLTSYTLALPFFRNFLIGTLAYGAVFYFVANYLVLRILTHSKKEVVRLNSL